MRLQNGDTIGIIALSGACNRDIVTRGISHLKDLGFNVKLGANIYKQNNYLAGTINEKLSDLYDLFQDTDVKLILNARGGYGAIKLINKIDYDIIRSNPKPFIGYSDITALLLMFYKKAGLVTFHGPMLCSDFGFGDSPLVSTIDSIFDALSGDELTFEGNKIYSSGEAKGILWGGNLATVASLCGIDFIPDEDFIFFAEDLNEPVYKIDRMFTQLFNIDKFANNCKGIVLGDFLNTDNEEWLGEFFKTLSSPTIGGFKITHDLEKITLPIGRKAQIKNSILTVY